MAKLRSFKWMVRLLHFVMRSKDWMFQPTSTAFSPSISKVNDSVPSPCSNTVFCVINTVVVKLKVLTLQPAFDVDVTLPSFRWTAFINLSYVSLIRRAPKLGMGFPPDVVKFSFVV